MLTTKMWIALCVVAAAASVLLYKTIDSDWARANNMTIVVTIAFFLAASMAVLCGFNAATMKKHSTGHE